MFINDTAYSKITFDNHPSLFVPLVPVAVLLSFVGILLNALLLITTARFKELRSRCNMLIANVALWDLFMCVCSLWIMWEHAFHLFFVDHRSCVRRQSGCVFSLTVESIAVFILGVDRLFALKIPIRYKIWPTERYLSIMVGSSIVAALVVTAMTIGKADPQFVIAACAPTFYDAPPPPIGHIFMLVINVAVVAVYGVAYREASKNMVSSNNDASNTKRRILRSLSVVVVVYLSTFALAVVVTLCADVITGHDLASIQYLYLSSYTAWPAVVNFSCNCVIYYWRSTQYRSAINKLLRIRQNQPTTAVIPLGSVATTKAAHKQSMGNALFTKRKGDSPIQGWGNQKNSKK